MATYAVMPNRNSRSLYQNARREAVVILLLWLVSSIYSGTFCYLYGYKTHEAIAKPYGPTVSQFAGPLTEWDRSPETLAFPMSIGIPDWVFYGVVIPWAICIVLTFVFCIFYYSEDDLSEGTESNDR